MHPQVDELMEIVIEKKVPVVTTGAGNPGKYVPALKEAGIKVMPVVASVALAQRMERLGVDAVIAEGTESGGHVGEMTTMALVPQVVDGVSIPVVAAGGIASGRQMLAAYALGACGVQVGTCLLVSEECPVHQNYKQAVLDASDSDTIVTGRIAALRYGCSRTVWHGNMSVRSGPAPPRRSWRSILWVPCARPCLTAMSRRVR